MENRYNQSSQSPRYTEIGPNGQILRQALNVPLDVTANYLTSPTQGSNYPYQNLNKNQWWQSAGPFNPYRTSYQDYGRQQNQSNFIYTPPHIQHWTKI